MKLTPAAGNLLVGAADRADNARRVARLKDMRMALSGSQESFENYVDILTK
jgi:hypothetical protein